ncbi:GNAT family N-acetyltransferase [Streptomyces sp. T-3]|nr:GNAT family N-acetyltransferase [Streptomyces sp. T-3]
MTHAVIVSNRHRYALWPSGTELPVGWHLTGWSGAEQTCLDLIAELWDDGSFTPPCRAPRVARRPSLVLLAGARLWLREARADEARSIAAGNDGGLNWADGSRSSLTQAPARAHCAALDARTHRPGWGLYLLMRTADAHVVGTMGFRGAPRDGSVELCFELLEQARGQGYAGEALDELAGWALRQSGVREVAARVLALPPTASLSALFPTSVGHVAARRVLERARFEPRPETDGHFRYVLTH